MERVIRILLSIVCSAASAIYVPVILSADEYARRYIVHACDYMSYSLHLGVSECIAVLVWAGSGGASSVPDSASH